MRYQFEDGYELLVLYEPHHDKQSFDIHRIAHYSLDMDKRYPHLPNLAIVIFTDNAKWRKSAWVPTELKIETLGKRRIFFQYELRKLKFMSKIYLAKGREEGFRQELVENIRFLQQVLKQSVTPYEEMQAFSLEELRQRSESLKRQLMESHR